MTEKIWMNSLTMCDLYKAGQIDRDSPSLDGREVAVHDRLPYGVHEESSPEVAAIQEEIRRRERRLYLDDRTGEVVRFSRDGVREVVSRREI